MNTIKASEVLPELQLSSNPAIQLIVDEIIKAQKRYHLGEQLTIEISTDYDFSVNGQNEFIERFALVGTVIESYEKALKTLDFGTYSHKNHHLERFLEMINDSELKDELSTIGSVARGGNSTIEVYLSKSPNVVSIGSLNINVAE